MPQFVHRFLHILLLLLSRLPLPLLHNLGAACGWLVYGFAPAYRRQLRANMQQAGLDAARAGAIAESGKTVFELPRLWRETHTQNLQRITQVSGWHFAEAARQAGHGIIFLTPHLGCFDLTAQYIAEHMPLTSLYRPPRQAWLAPLMLAGRGKSMQLAPTDRAGVRRLLKALRANEAIGMLPDQVPGSGEGVWAPFFGRLAYTMTLAARLAETGATVLLVWAKRLPYGAGYELALSALPSPLSGSLEARCTVINAAMETLIRQCPEQYLWAYNRYKQPDGAPPPRAC